ncbi:MAG: EF-hand domain-containing protein [Bacillota bacterium]|nr:EF-hand domain-containing protein [Bacillota bacterium]
MSHRMFGKLATGIVLVACIATTAAFAQGMGPHPRGMDGPHPGMMMKWDEMDANHDGKISAAEHAAYAKARFDKLDANHDGVITKEEMHAHMEAMMRDHKAKMFDRMDANHDGMISRDEMEAAMKTMHGGMDGGMDGGMHGDHMKKMDGMKDDDDSMEHDDTPPPSK